MKCIDTPFGPIKFVSFAWMPPDQLILFTPGNKTEIRDEAGNLVSETWERKPSAVIIKNIAIP